MIELTLLRDALPADLRERLDESLRWLKSAGEAMHAAAQAGLAGLTEPASLADTLRHRTAPLLAEPLTVRFDGDPGGLGAQETATIITVIELFVDVLACRRVRVQASVTIQARFFRVSLLIFGPAGDRLDAGAPELTELDVLAGALGGRATAMPGQEGWQAHVTLSRPVATAAP